MEPLLSLPRDQFLAALAELQLDPERTDFLVEQYDAANAPAEGAGSRGMMYNLLDNIIGYDDDIVTPGERLGAGVQEFASGLLSDPLGTGADIVRGGYETIERAMAPGATPMDVLGAAGVAMGAGGLLSRPAGSLGMGGRVARDFDVSRRDASNIFGEGSERVRYTDPESGGTMEVVVRPDGRASVLELEVPEDFRGQGIGQSLQARVMQDFPVMGGQVSSRAAAATAYRLGRRPYGMPDATLEDVFRIMDEDSSVNLISPAAQPTDLAANRSTSVGLLASAAETPAQRVARLLREGRADDVTDDLMAQADPQEMYQLYVSGETGMDLPMDEASRMARAREMGFDVDTPLYHGTPTADIQAFRASRSGAAGPGVYTSQMPSTASGYAEGMGLFDRRNAFSDDTGTWIEGGNVLEVVGPRNLQSSEDWTANMMAQMSSNPMSRQQASAGATQQAISEGFEGAQARSPISSMGRNVVVFDPSNVRSRFARFDPRLSQLANLNAANIDPLTGAAAIGASQQEQDPLANLRAYIAQNGLLSQ